jgi:hypothetical protein
MQIHYATPCRKAFPGRVRGTADPSTALRSGRDDKGEGGALREDWLVAGKTADPSTALRSGRDDTSVWGWVLLPKHLFGVGC